MNDGKKHFERGMARKSDGDHEAARVELQRAVELMPECPEAWAELGWVTYALQIQLDDAATCLERAVQLDPRFGTAHLYLGVVLNRLDRRVASESHFRSALGLLDDAALGHAVFAEEFLWRNSRYGEAEEHFLAALKVDPRCTLALRHYAEMLGCHGRDIEALELFKRGLNEAPNDNRLVAAYDRFLAQIDADDRDPNECLRAAVEKDPHYVRGILSLNEGGSLKP